MKTCSIEGCERRHHGNGLCDAHSKLKMREEQPEYTAWQEIKRRCYNKNCIGYSDYGGRGIEMCDRWRNDFKSFLADMGKRPSEEYSIERQDVNGNYEPENCKWATLFEQANNKRNNRFITYEGKSLTCSQWSRLTGIPRIVIYNRLYMGWDAERIFNQTIIYKPSRRKELA